MIRLLADENFDGSLIRGLLRKSPELDLIRVQDTELMGASDPEVLEWAASEDRMLLTHDVDTLIDFAYERVRRGQKMPGVLEVKDSLPFRLAIEEILIVALCSHEGEWENQVRYIPL